MREDASNSPRGTIADPDAIRRILIAEWNPIGCGVPGDEYDSYIPGIYRLMQADTDVHKLSRHLGRLETVSMGLRGNAQRNDSVARSLLALIGQHRP